MTTPAQSIFPPKPKQIITPLTPKFKADAIKKECQQASIQSEPESGDQGGQTPKTSRRNRLQREAEGEE